MIALVRAGRAQNARLFAERRKNGLFSAPAKAVRLLAVKSEAAAACGSRENRAPARTARESREEANGRGPKARTTLDRPAEAMAGRGPAGAGGAGPEAV